MIEMQTQISRAGVWVAIRQLLVRSISIIQLLILAKILSPAEFGLFSVAMTAYAFVEAMTFLGFGQALIQRSYVSHAHLSTLFVVNILRGLFICLIVLALAKPIGVFLHSPQSWNLFAAISIIPLIIGFHNPAMILFQKNLQMKQEFLFYVAGAVVNFCSSLIFATKGYGAWSLVLGLIAQSTTHLIVSYLISAYRPSLLFSPAIFSQMFHFGKWLLVSQVLKYFSNCLPVWVIGYYFGFQSLGIYHVAGRFSQSIGSEFSALVSIIAFPAFSKIAGNYDKLSNAYLSSQKIILSSSFFIFGAIISFSDTFQSLLFSEEWSGVKTLIFLFSLVGLVQSIGSQSEILKALNLPSVIAKLSLFRFIIVVPLTIYLAKNWGSAGALMASLMPSLLILLPSMLVILDRLSIELSIFLRIIAVPLIAFAAMIIATFVLDASTDFNFYGSVLILCWGLFLYIIVFALADRLLNTKVLSEWRSAIGRILT
jgi:O-antigen/teichoic acid export membrane protein